ncbi:MAG: hypothetical protein ACKN89_17300 [Cyanobium sp.]|jgi:hypothetical protein|nr:hypothetical protein [Synechococcaceae cyanobacterium]
MKGLINLLLVPLRAPMLLLLLAVSAYLGARISAVAPTAPGMAATASPVSWWVECLQAVIVVVICSIPDLLLRQVSVLMIASRVLSLVITLLVVTMGGLYLLHLNVLANVLILASSVMLARLDLARIRIFNPPLLITGLLALIVLAGMTLGQLIQR